MRVLLVLYFVYGFTVGQITGPGNRFLNVGAGSGNGASQLNGMLPGLSGPGNGAGIPFVPGNGVLPGQGMGSSGPGKGVGIPFVPGNGLLPGQGMGSSGPGFGRVFPAVSALGNSGPGSMNTPQGVLNTNSLGANPSQLVTSNCVNVGNPCTPGAGPCCLSPVFSCQNAAIGNFCMVVPRLVPNIPQISQILSTNGISTPNPIV